MSMRHASEHRSQRRLVRRWKRRLRIAAPFLSVPLLLGMLVLSVDLIEYRPEEPPKRLSERPIPPAPETADRSDRRSVSAASIAQPEPIPFARPARISPTALELELDLQLPELNLPPVPAPARP
jgi:hypothetical protein